MPIFKAKLFYVEAKFSLAYLDRMHQLDTYVKRFHDKALDCCDVVEERVLVDVCLPHKLEKYCIFLHFPS